MNVAFLLRQVYVDGSTSCQFLIYFRSTNTLTSLEANTQRDALVNIGNNREFIKPKLVTVIKNGKPPQQKVTMLLNQKTAVSYDQVLDHLSARGCLGKVDKLYAVDGKLVCRSIYAPF